MNTFHLQIVTPNGLFYDEQAQKVIVRTIGGDVCILSGHIEYMSPLGEGKLQLTTESGDVKTARCSGGFISVKKEITRVVASDFEWTEEH